MEVIIIIVLCLAFLTFKGLLDQKRNAKMLRKKVIDAYGRAAERTLDAGRAESIAYYCRCKERTDCSIDDITWADLDMDRVYYLLNSCKSSIGDEFLYRLLRNPVSDISELKERDRVARAFAENEELRTEVGVFLAGMGYIRNISVYEYISRLNGVKADNTVKHVVQALALVVAICSVAINPLVGVLLSIGVFVYNIVTYFKRKSEIECYFTIFGYILGMLKAADKIEKISAVDTENAIEGYLSAIEDAKGRLKKITKGASVFVNPLGSGDLLQTCFDYLRMAFHVDLIKFNSIITKLPSMQSEFDTLFLNIGMLDCMLAVASYREWVGTWGTPELSISSKECKPFFKVTDIAHPLIEEPVTNSFGTQQPVLLTGSNASGKSTFLKTVAINAILAQSIYTVRASAYAASCFKVMSSIALRDDLESGESYYIVEIKSLKRIIDAAFAASTEKADDNAPAVPVLCFIDEVLRGTNTVERISASTEILKKLASGNVLCFAATHDIELTYLLEHLFRNCHFEERVENDMVLFDYTLREGRATTRNAIKLLSLMGFDEDIVSAASKRAQEMAESKKM